MKEFFANHPEKRESQSIGEVYRLLEAKKEQFDPRAFLTPIMDTVMYGVIPDEDVAALMAVVEKGRKRSNRYSDRRIWLLWKGSSGRDGKPG